MKNKTIFVSNLPTKFKRNALKLNLYILFNHYGKILNIEIPHKNELKGIAFITFKEHYSVESVIIAGLPEFFGKKIVVEVSKNPSKIELLSSDVGLSKKFYFYVLNFPTKIVEKIAPRLFKNYSGIIGYEVYREDGVNTVLKLSFDTDENRDNALKEASKIKLAGSELVCELNI